MEIKENYSLKALNTFGIDAKADYFVEINYPGDLKKLVENDIFKTNKYFILGSGSNVLFSGDYKGLIISINLKGMQIKKSTDAYLIVEAGAGIIWHDFVKTCVKSQWYGPENLALIPGKVGAAPVQNIGAYGMEQKDIFHSLSGFDIKAKEFRTLPKEECKFGYRDSIFKNELKNQFIVSSVTYKLSKVKKLNLSYKALSDEVNKFCIENPDLQYIFDAVCRIRKSKLPDPEQIGNGGSFYKNPVIDEKHYLDLQKKHPSIPSYKLDGNKHKIPAAWLIEESGWKGKNMGDAGVYPKHALILVNYGNASGKDILFLAEGICKSVREKFGIDLEKEVLVV